MTTYVTSSVPTKDNFSYNFIPENCCVHIPDYQEMIVSRLIDIEGDIVLDGDIVFLEA